VRWPTPPAPPHRVRPPVPRSPRPGPGGAVDTVANLAGVTLRRSWIIWPYRPRQRSACGTLQIASGSAGIGMSEHVGSRARSQCLRTYRRPVSTGDLERWDRIALSYAASTGGDDDSFYRQLAPFLRTQIGDNLTGRRILDLGCGHGWLGARLAAAGADVVGIDGSSTLIQQAQAAHPKLTWRVHDLTEPFPADWGRFDVVIAHMVLMDIPDLHQLLAGVGLHLLEGGTFVFTILHPSFFNQPIQGSAKDGWVRAVRGYLDLETWDIDSFGGHRRYHRPLTWYAQQLLGHGFVVTGIDEPPTLPKHTRPSKNWTDYERWFSRLPTMMSIACRHPPSTASRPST